MWELYFFFFLSPASGDEVDPLTVCVNRQLQAPARQRFFTPLNLFICFFFPAGELHLSQDRLG